MASIISVWPVTGSLRETRVMELVAVSSEDDGITYWIDSRDEFGRLVASEPFDSQGEAREYAMRAISPIVREWID